MNSEFLSSEWICNSLSDLQSLHLSLIGCFVSVFTLLYSFIISKKGDLKLFAEQLNRGDKSPTIIQRQKFAINFIKRMRMVANYCLLLLMCSILSVIGCWMGLRLLDGCWRQRIFIAVSLLTILAFGMVIYLSYKVLKQYLDDIRI